MLPTERVIRVFPRRTRATPDDELAFTAPPPKIIPDTDKVYVSVTFTYDMEKAEQLAAAWRKTGLPVTMGGPAFNMPGGDFVPGMFLRKGYVITSRGCFNRCTHCSVPAREGYTLRELPIVSGYNILDDNLLACSDTHIRNVFEMLKNQPERPLFTGGLEAKRVKPWHIELLLEVKTARMYFAYDSESEYEPLVYAGRMLREGGFTKASQKARAYVLIGYPGDTMDKAEKRLRDAWKAGFLPFAMLFRNETGETHREWRQFARLWTRPHILYRLLKEEKDA